MSRGRKTVAIVVGSLLGLLLLFSLLMPSLCRSSETANRVKCASNLRQIGQAILLYTQANGGAYPDTLEKLLLTQDITAEVFTCPSSNDEKALGDTPAEVASHLNERRHLSYIYLGSKFTKDTPADTVVMYEYLIDHDEDGSNLLYADGLEWENKQFIKDLIARGSTTAPTTNAPTSSPTR